MPVSRRQAFNAANGTRADHWGTTADSRVEPSSTAAATQVSGGPPTIQAWVQREPRRSGAPQPFSAAGPTNAPSPTCPGWVTSTTTLRSQGDDRRTVFLWVHYMDTHTPYVPAPRHAGSVGQPLRRPPRCSRPTSEPGGLGSRRPDAGDAPDAVRGDGPAG